MKIMEELINGQLEKFDGEFPDLRATSKSDYGVVMAVDFESINAFLARAMTAAYEQGQKEGNELGLKGIAISNG